MLVQAVNVGVRFSRQLVFENIFFELYAGDRLCIIGKSGEGKSVLFRLLIGLMAPSEGKIMLRGQTVYPLSPQMTQWMGVVFQNPALMDAYTVWENIAIRDLYQNQKPAEMLEKVQAILPKVGLSPQDAYKKIDELSGGMKKRVSIARALYHQPEFLFFDEPHSGLDPINAQLIDQLIQQVFQPHNVLVMVTHNLHAVQSIANKILLIDQQKGYFFPSLQDFYHSHHPVIQHFLKF